MSQITPGLKLKIFIEELYPLTETNDHFAKMDYDLMADGSLKKLLYESHINYLLRRLVKTAEHYKRRFPVTAFGEGRYRQEMRFYFRNYTRYNDRHIDKLVQLLNECLLATEQRISSGIGRKVRKAAQENDRYCYICGRIINYLHGKNLATDEGTFPIADEYIADAPTLDHKWPRSLGGFSYEENIDVACSDCNNKQKGDFIDASDHHYEEIAFVAASYEDYAQKEKNRRFEIAVFEKTFYRCFICEQPAHRVGELSIGRLESGDSWHFLNLVPYCAVHKPKE